MIAGIFHQGSGIGNQLFRYIATRIIATQKGLDWGMQNPELCKMDFMNLDLGVDVVTDKVFNEKKVVENGIDIRSYDPEYNFIEDGTLIDGEFQDPRYFMHRIDEVGDWLKVTPLSVPDDVCVIGFRGGEYVGVHDLFLPKDYWDEAISRMKKINPNMKFEVHTDDLETADKFFPSFKKVRNADINWRSIRYAKYSIISNSSFYILPRLLRHHQFPRDFIDKSVTIAPRYWARRNIGVWALPSNYYKEFHYI